MFRTAGEIHWGIAGMNENPEGEWDCAVSYGVERSNCWWCDTSFASSKGFVFDAPSAASNATGSEKVMLYTAGVTEAREPVVETLDGFGIEKGSSTSLERLYTMISCMYKTAI